MCNVLHDPFVRASASRVQELIQEFEIGNYGKTLLCSVGIVKGELDCDGHFILEDGMATVLALKTLQERYVREKEQAGNCKATSLSILCLCSCRRSDSCC